MRRKAKGRPNKYELMVAPTPIAAKHVPSAPTSPPLHLSPEMRAWFSEVVSRHRLDSHRLHLLRCAAESFDRAQTAREQVLAEGATFVDKNQNLRAHPGIATERDAKVLFAKLLRQLELDPAKIDGRLGPRHGGGIGVHYADLPSNGAKRPWE